MKTLNIYEPAMCCETGVCGVDPDAQLIRFSADIEWLRNQGVEVRRFNLAQEPSAFIDSAVVKAEIDKHGEHCLPLLLIDDDVASRGQYPDRPQLQALLNIASPDHTGNQPANTDTNSGGCTPGNGCC